RIPARGSQHKRQTPLNQLTARRLIAIDQPSREHRQRIGRRPDPIKSANLAFYIPSCGSPSRTRTHPTTERPITIRSVIERLLEPAFRHHWISPRHHSKRSSQWGVAQPNHTGG